MSELLLKINLTPGEIIKLLELGREKWNIHDLNEICSIILQNSVDECYDGE